jgi:hypothetical protein
MIPVLLYHLLLFQCLGNCPPRAPFQDTSYLENTRQLMTDIRNNRIMSDTLYISREAYPIRTAYCDYLFKDTVNFSAGELQELHAAVHDSPLKIWSPDLVGGPARLVRSDSLINVTRVIMGPGYFEFYLKIKGDLWNFTAPLFFRDYTLCLMDVTSYGGTLSMSQRLSLFRKVDGHWKEIRSFCHTMS